MIVMKNPKEVLAIRIGKDISIAWSGTVNGQPLNEEIAKDISVQVKAKDGSVYQLKTSFDDGKVKAMFYGIRQKQLGIYTIIVWYKNGEVGQSALDHFAAFELVETSQEETENEENADNLFLSAIEMDGDILTSSFPQLVKVKGEKGDKGEPGEKGDKGDKGDKGEPFVYEDFTPEQLEELKGERGEQGEQGERGEKGDKGEPSKLPDGVDDFFTPHNESQEESVLKTYNIWDVVDMAYKSFAIQEEIGDFFKGRDENPRGKYMTIRTLTELEDWKHEHLRTLATSEMNKNGGNVIELFKNIFSDWCSPKDRSCTTTSNTHHGYTITHKICPQLKEDEDYWSVLQRVKELEKGGGGTSKSLKQQADFILEKTGEGWSNFRSALEDAFIGENKDLSEEEIKECFVFNGIAEGIDQAKRLTQLNYNKILNLENERAPKNAILFDKVYEVLRDGSVEGLRTFYGETPHRSQKCPIEILLKSPNTGDYVLMIKLCDKWPKSECGQGDFVTDIEDNHVKYVSVGSERIELECKADWGPQKGYQFYVKKQSKEEK